MLESNTKAAYREAAKCLLANLPLSNTTIREMAALDPGMRKSATEAFFNLAQKLPNVICPSDLPKLRLELADYSTDSSLDDLQSKVNRIDSGWWCHIFKVQEKGGMRFPFLSILAKALLSVFSGPLIESTFNLMDDVVRHDRCSLNLETYEAIMRVKYHFAASKQSSHTYNVGKSMVSAVSHSYATYCDVHKKRREEKKEAARRRIATSKSASSTARASSVCSSNPYPPTESSKSSSDTHSSKSSKSSSDTHSSKSSKSSSDTHSSKSSSDTQSSTKSASSTARASSVCSSNPYPPTESSKSSSDTQSSTRKRSFIPGSEPPPKKLKLVDIRTMFGLSQP